MKKPLLIAALLLSAIPTLAATQRALWKFPKGADFEALQVRPNGKIAIYWEIDEGSKSHSKYAIYRTTIDEKSGQVLGKSFLPGINVGTDIEKETFNKRGQHAYLPHCDARTTNFLRLKAGNGYRILKNLPRFGYGSYDVSSLHDLKFSPDGEVLKVLGKDRLWIVGAQTGKLLRVIRPQQGQWWSRENAALSPDGFTILGMRDKMTLFSAKSGQLLKSFGVHVETVCGGCGCLEARIEFSPDGRSTYAFDDNTDLYEFPATGGKMTWSGEVPFTQRFSHDGRFYFDFKRSPDQTSEYPVVKSARSHQIVTAFPDLPCDSFTPSVEFSSDGKSIYWVSDGTLWQRPLNLK